MRIIAKRNSFVFSDISSEDMGEKFDIKKSKISLENRFFEKKFSKKKKNCVKFKKKCEICNSQIVRDIIYKYGNYARRTK